MRKPNIVKEWTRDEEIFFFENAEKLTAYAMSRKLDTTVNEVSNKAKELKVNFKRTQHNWTIEEDRRIRRIAGNLTIKEIVKEFPNRKKNSILSYMNRNNISYLRNKVGRKPTKAVKNDNSEEDSAETNLQYLSRKIGELNVRRDELYEDLKGKYSQETYESINSIGVEIEQLTKQQKNL